MNKNRKTILFLSDLLRGDPREVSTTVIVNLPSDYNEVVCGYVRDMQVCLTPLILMVHTIYIEINRVNKKSLTSYLTIQKR